MAVFRFIEGWYTPHRRHSRLGYLSSLAYERATIEAEEPVPGGTPDMGRGEIAAPGQFYEVDLRPDPARPPPITS